MTARARTSSRRSLIVFLVFATVVVVLALVFRMQLLAWFSGKSSSSGAGEAAALKIGPYSLTAALEPDPPVEKDQVLVLGLRDAAGKQLDDAKMEVEYDMPAMGAMAEMKGSSRIEHEGKGEYRAHFDLPMGGTWTLKTTISDKTGSYSQRFTMTVGSKGLAKVGGAAGVSSAEDKMASPPAVEYPPAVFDTLRAAMDAYERLRSDLARDRTGTAPEASRTLAEALRAAAAALPPGQAGTKPSLDDAAVSADKLGSSKSLDDARHALAELSARLLPVLGADQRLISGKHVFECPMFEHARWMQPGTTADNPYMGSKMPTCGTEESWQPSAQAAASAATPGEIDHYTCSMHPSVRQAGPGKCPICGMDLLPVTKEQQAEGVVLIDEGRRQLIGVRTGPVVEAPLRSTFRAVGRITYDESALTEVNLKVSGWISKLLVSQTGQRVARGQTLFLMYSPELYNAQQDFLLATHGAQAAASPSDAGARNPSFGNAARKRLKLLGLSSGQIDAIAAKGEPIENIAIPSPASGFVIEKDVTEGAAVQAGMRLYRIATLNKVWVEADVYEADLPHVRVGQAAKVTLDYLPGAAYDAKVSYVYPYLDPASRAGRVRIELVNKELELRPGMYASVELGSDIGPRVQVPASAVVYTGPRRLVFVDLGEGRFRPQEVRVGTEAGGMYEVLEGLKPGDVVATSGVFLIAAEARISTAAKYWENEPTAADAGSPAPMGSAEAPIPSGKKSPAAPVFTCPMHPEVQSKTPGKCPKCGMDLVPKAGGAKR